jgi:hypothetical protein
MVEEPSPLTQATPPICEQKKEEEEKEERKREEEKNRHRREKKSTRKIMSGYLLCGRHLSNIKKLG